MQQNHIKRYRLEVPFAIDCNRQCQGIKKELREEIRKLLTKSVTSDYSCQLGCKTYGLQVWFVFMKKPSEGA